MARLPGRADGQAFRSMSATLARATAIFCSRKKAQKITEYRDTAPLNLLVLFLELSGRCGASSRRSCGNVTFGVDVGVIKRSVSSVTKEHEDERSTRKEKYSVTMHMEKTGVTKVMVLSSGNSRKIDLDN